MASIARVMRPAAARLTAAHPQPAVFTRRFPITPARSSTIPRAFSTTRAAFAKLYTQDHEWIELSEDSKTATIGISDYAAHALGDVVYVELPEVDAEVSIGDPIGGVESVKSASDINSPVTCKVIAVNESLDDTPGLINKAPENGSEGGGWVAKIELKDVGTKEAQGLMSAEEYKEFIAGVEDEA